MAGLQAVCVCVCVSERECVCVCAREGRGGLATRVEWGETCVRTVRVSYLWVWVAVMVLFGACHQMNERLDRNIGPDILSSASGNRIEARPPSTADEILDQLSESLGLWGKTKS
jgi:hypothetical protein